jgi:DNA topoisomerase-1
MYAAMIKTDYASKETFIKNFWREFKELLGAGHAIKDLKKCDFQPIADYLDQDRERKKALTKEEKLVHILYTLYVYCMGIIYI